MNLKEKIQNDFKEAFKGKEAVKLGALKMLRAEIHNAEISKRKELDEEEIIEVVSREIKKRRDSVVMYERGGRDELAEDEKNEIEVLLAYLPAQLNEDEIRELVKKAAEQAGASGAKDIGKVMAVLMPQARGRADSALVSRIVKEILG